VTFYPEFRRFQMERFDDDIVALMRKRVYDMAGLLPAVKVFLDGNQLEVNSFLKYVDMYFNNTEECIKVRD
jgi:DNA topoisomerase II